MATPYNRLNPFPTQITNLDFDLSMLPNPSTGDIRTKSNLDSIIQSMKTIVFTNFGERPFQPSLSCNMQRMLFNQIDRVTALQIQQEIAQTLTAFEPRVNITDVLVAQPSNPNELDVQIQFTLVNSPTVLSIQLFLFRKR